MNPERWRQIDDLLVRALERDPGERSAFLHAEAGDDSDLRREVGALIRASAQETVFFDRPALGGVSAVLPGEGEDASRLVGKRFGAYRVESVIATGGMGAVCLGVRDDEAFEKRVAIKVVRRGGGSSGAWSPESLSRFHLERQVLAELEHPSISRLIDGGTDESGRPYLVMEHVEGRPIDAHCDGAGLTIPERLRLFLEVCRAVQHAHQRLIIHRDLKPGNILVTPDGRAKLLDFGLAKIIDPHRAALGSPQTEAGRFMGTIAYAAPEQVAGPARDQDVRTDVYALGMILYRLVAGVPAYETGGSLSDVLDRIVRRVPRPPSGANPRVGRDLDSIVMKALAKRRDDRYGSAAALGADIERLLAGAPVQARGSNGLYAMGKALHRHRLAFGVVLGVFLVVASFGVAMTVQAARLQERRRALESALRTSNIERARTLGSTGSIVEAEQILWRELLDSLPRDSGDLREGDRATYWALWELYAHHPCRWTADLPGALGAKTRLARDGSAVLLARDGHATVGVDAGTGEVIWAIPDGVPAVAAVACEGLGHDVWIAAPDGAVMRWRPGQPAPGPVLETAIEGPSGLRVVAGHCLVVWNDSAAVLVDPGASVPGVRIEIPGTRIREVALSPDERLIAVATDDGHARVFDARSGVLIETLLEPERWVSRLAFSPDGRFLACDVDGADVAVIEVATGVVAARLTETAGWISSLCFHPLETDPPILLGASIDKSAYVWEIPSGRLVRRLGGHATPLYDAVFSADGSAIVTLGDGAVRAWDLELDAWVDRWAESDSVFDAVFMPDGRGVLTATGDRKNALILRATDGRVERAYTGHEAPVTSLAVTAGGAAVISTSHDGTARLWDLREHRAAPGRVIIETGDTVINSVDYAPAAGIAVFGCDDGLVRVRSPEGRGGREDLVVEAQRVPSVALSADGRWLAAALLGRNSVLLHDRESGIRRELVAHTQALRVVAFSPDGLRMASAGDDLAIRVWSTSPGRVGALEHDLVGHRSDVFALAFSPDGSLLVSGGRGGNIRVWDVADGRLLATWSAHDDMVFTIAFNPDGRSLLTAGRDRSIAVWQLDHFEKHLAGNRAHYAKAVDCGSD